MYIKTSIGPWNTKYIYIASLTNLGWLFRSWGMYPSCSHRLFFKPALFSSKIFVNCVLRRAWRIVHCWGASPCVPTFSSLSDACCSLVHYHSSHSVESLLSSRPVATDAIDRCCKSNTFTCRCSQEVLSLLQIYSECPSAILFFVLIFLVLLFLYKYVQHEKQCFYLPN